MRSITGILQGVTFLLLTICNGQFLPRQVRAGGKLPQGKRQQPDSGVVASRQPGPHAWQQAKAGQEAGAFPAMSSAGRKWSALFGRQQGMALGRNSEAKIGFNGGPARWTRNNPRGARMGMGMGRPNLATKGTRNGLNNGKGGRASNKDALAAARVARIRACDASGGEQQATARPSSASLRSVNSSDGPGPEGFFPVPTIIGVCCERSGSSSLYEYLGRLAAAQGRPKGVATPDVKELAFFSRLAAQVVDWELSANAATPTWIKGSNPSGAQAGGSNQEGARGGLHPILEPSRKASVGEAGAVCKDSLQSFVPRNATAALVWTTGLRLLLVTEQNPDPRSRYAGAPDPKFLYSAYAGRWLRSSLGKEGEEGTVVVGKDGTGASSDGAAPTSQFKGAWEASGLSNEAVGADPNFCAAFMPANPTSAQPGVESTPVQPPVSLSHRKQVFSPYVTFDFSPMYSEYGAPWAMRAVLPDPRSPVLVVILREPIQRAVTGWFRNSKVVEGVDKQLPADFEWELETVIKLCLPHAYAASMMTDRLSNESAQSATRGPDNVAEKNSGHHPSAGHEQTAKHDITEAAGRIPDAASCAASGNTWEAQSGVFACVGCARTSLAPDPSKGNSSVNAGLYDRWLLRGLHSVQMRNLLCAGFAPRQIVVTTLTELSTDPGAMLRRISRAVDRAGASLVGEASPVFDSGRLLEDEIHVVSGAGEREAVTLDVLPGLLRARLKRMYAVDIRDLLALVTRRNGFWVDEEKLAAEFEAILN